MKVSMCVVRKGRLYNSNLIKNQCSRKEATLDENGQENRFIKTSKVADP